MRFTETPLDGAFVIDGEFHVDERGYFVRTFCADEFSKHGLNVDVSQTSLSFNEKCGTLRGMHFQSAPFAETKLVRCTSGAIYDVIVDIRPESETFLRWYAVELSAENGRSIFIPEGFAHGFQTLRHKSEVHYQTAPAYNPNSAAGFVWNDRLVAIDWPLQVTMISEKDIGLPGVTEAPL